MVTLSLSLNRSFMASVSWPTSTGVLGHVVKATGRRALRGYRASAQAHAVIQVGQVGHRHAAGFLARRSAPRHFSGRKLPQLDSSTRQSATPRRQTRCKDIDDSIRLGTTCHSQALTDFTLSYFSFVLPPYAKHEMFSEFFFAAAGEPCLPGRAWWSLPTTRLSRPGSSMP